MGDLFDVKTSRGLDVGHLKLFSHYKDGLIEFIGRTKENYGLQGYIELQSFSPNPEKTISISQIGSNHAQLRKVKRYSSQNIFVLYPKDERLLTNYLITLIDKYLLKYGVSYTSYPTLKEIPEILLSLPVENGEISFKYMERYIQELEAERLEELEAYFLATGLKNTHLTSKEQDALDKFEGGGMVWNNSKIVEIFDIVTPKMKINANTISSFTGSFPYVVRTDFNNGIRGNIDFDEKYLNSGNTISFGQDTATVFYQKEAYFTGDKIKIFLGKDFELNRYRGLYFISTLRKSFSGFVWGSSSFNVNILNNTCISLPIKDQKPDFDFMETFIRAIEKLVISDLVERTDRKMQAYRNVVERN